MLGRNNLRSVGFASLGLLALFVGQACGGSDDAGSGTQGEVGGRGGAGGSVTGGSAGSISLGGGAGKPDIFVDDPPPPVCPGVPVSPPITGNKDCPSDKNNKGCPCSPVGAEAPCWPGYRKNRERGICRDGVATCKAIGETQSEWTECKGYVLPQDDAATSKERCECFSGGQWKLDNLSLCFLKDGSGTYTGEAVSTVLTSNGTWACPADLSPQAPAEPFSTSTLTVDCAGHFTLCYTLHAGPAAQAKPTDCVVTRVCTEADYTTVDQPQIVPPLPGWATTTPEQVACAKKFTAEGGYAQLSVEGQTVLCDTLPERTFVTLSYCSLLCSKTPDAPQCAQCQDGGSGSF